MSTPRRALISGASIAGPTLAYWLTRNGWDVTVVERSQQVRGGGYAIDIRGSAAEVAQRMGIYDECYEARVRPRTSHMLSPGGHTMVKISPSDIIAAVNTIDVELPRGDLTTILYSRTKDSSNYVFGDSIASIAQHDAGVDVEFVNGAPGTFDVVLGCDGIHSNTRKLVFGPEQDYIQHLGPCVCICVLREPVERGDVSYFWSKPGRTMAIGPMAAADALGLKHDGDDGNRAFIVFLTPDPGAIDVDDHKQMVRAIRQAFAGDKWKAPQILKSLETAEDVYFDTVSQIRIDRWSEGRVGLVGDSAYAPSFLSGQGTSIAMLGAYAVATELVATDDVPAALKAAEAKLRPFIDKNQALALRKGSTVLPRDTKALWKRNAKFMAVPWLKRLGLMKKISGDVREASNDFPLGGYGLR